MSSLSSDLEPTVYAAFEQPDRVARLATKIGTDFRGVFFTEINELIAELPGIASGDNQLVSPLPRPVERALRAWEVSYAGQPIPLADS